jgi:hypothetical protein
VAEVGAIVFLNGRDANTLKVAADIAQASVAALGWMPRENRKLMGSRVCSPSLRRINRAARFFASTSSNISAAPVARPTDLPVEW